MSPLPGNSACNIQSAVFELMIAFFVLWSVVLMMNFLRDCEDKNHSLILVEDLKSCDI